MELVSGIHRVDGIRGVNCYLVHASDGLYVVDTGMPGSARRILRTVESLGKRDRDVRLILLTHSDLDHMGSAAALKRATGAAVAIHRGDAASLAGAGPRKTAKGLVGALLRLLMTLIRVEKLKADVLLEDGAELGPLRVIATPGHTQGHCCFLHEASGTILAGDALRTTKDGGLRISPDAMNLSTAQAWRSVAALAEVDFEALLPGHGEPVLQGAAERVRRLLRRHGA